MKVKRIEIKAAMNRLKFFFKKNSIISSMYNALLCISQSSMQIKISVTDIETYITETIRCEKSSFDTVIPNDKLFLLDFSKLKKIIDNSYSEYIDITESSHGVCIKSDEGRHFLVPYDKIENFPKKLSYPVSYYSFSSDTNALSVKMKKVVEFSSKDELKPSLNGVMFDKGDKEIILAASDGHRLISTSSEIEHSPLGGFQPFIMNRKLSNFIASNKLGVCQFKISNAANKYNQPCLIVIENENTEIVSRLIEDQMVNWRAVLPEQRGVMLIHLNRKNLTRILKCANELSNASTKKINFSIKNNRVKISCEDEDMSSSVFDIEVDSIREEFNEKIQFNCSSKFFLQSLSFSKSDTVKVQFSLVPTKPFFVDDDIMIMPLMGDF